MRTGRELVAVTRAESRFAVEVRHAGTTEPLEADAVLLALGRTANTEGLGLGELGVELGAQGTVVVGDDLQTSVAGIYAAGDVIGEPTYVYAAAYEGALAAENALVGAAAARDYTAIPWVIFTDPQVAGVGLNEKQAAARGVEVDVSVLPLSSVPRALAARDTRGFVKLLRARGKGSARRRPDPRARRGRADHGGEPDAEVRASGLDCRSPLPPLPHSRRRR